MTILSGNTHPVARHANPAGAIHWHHAPVRKLVSRWVSNLLQDFRTWQENRINRAAAENLRGLDPRILADIGITEGDVDHVLSLPLSVNAATELNEIRRHNRDNWLRRKR